MNYSTTFFLTLALLQADPAGEAAIKKDLEALQGTWLQGPNLAPGTPPELILDLGLLIHEIKGNKIHVDHLRRSDRVGQAYVIDSVMDGALTIDPTKDPPIIDVVLTAGRNKGKTCLGIYRVEANFLTFRLSQPGEPRPTKFADGGAMNSKLVRTSRETINTFIADADAQEAVSGLPGSGQARPIDPAADQLVVRLGADGSLVVPGQDEGLASFARQRSYFQQEYAKRARKEQAVETVVVLRAPRSAASSSLFQVARGAHAAGFHRLTLAVRRSKTEEGRLDLILPDWRRALPDLLIDGIWDTETRALDGFHVVTDPDNMVIETIPDEAGLQRELKARRDAKGALVNKDGIWIETGDQLAIEQLVRIIDACRRAGFTQPTLHGRSDAKEVPSGKLPVPTPAAQARAGKHVRAIYRDLYAASRPAMLAARLREASRWCDDPAARFVFLRESASAEVRAGKLGDGMRTFDDVESAYAASMAGQKFEALKNTPAGAAVVDAAVAEAVKASQQGQRDDSTRFLDLADSMARSLKDQDLIEHVESRRALLNPASTSEKPTPKPPRPNRDLKTTKTAPAKAPASSSKPAAAEAGLPTWYLALGGVVMLGTTVGTFLLLMRRSDRAARRRVAAIRSSQAGLPDAEATLEPPAETGETGP